MTEKLKDASGWYREHPSAAAFLLSLFLLLIYSIIQGIYPFGKVTFLRKDLYHQYLPFLYELRRRLLAGESLSYSFSLGPGASFYAMYVYYLSDPLNLLSVLVPERFLLEFLTFITYLKIALASASMCLYLTYRSRKLRASYALVLGLCYGFSGYITAYDWNVMWMWGIALAPAAIMCTERLILRDGNLKDALYFIAVMAFITWTNYYIAMIMDIFLVVYFAVLSASFFRGIKGTVVSFLRFISCSVLSAGISAVLLVPELKVIRNSSFTGNSFPKHLEFYMSVPRLMLRSLAAAQIETGLEHDPGIYASLILLFLVPLYFLNRNISLKHRIINALFILFFYLSFETNVLEFIWHGLNYPDSIPARQAFLLIWLYLALAGDGLEFEYADSMGNKRLAAALLFPMAFYLICLVFVRDDPHADIYTWSISLAYILLYSAIMIMYIFLRDDYFKWGRQVLCMLVVSELVINFNMTSVRDVSRENYFSHLESYRELASGAEGINPVNQGLFTRFDTVHENIRNQSSIAGYNDASYFSSTIDSGAEDFYKEFGMKASKVHYMAEGLTPFTAAIMGIDYILADDFRNNQTDYDVAFYKDEYDSDYLYESLFMLPLGYTIPEGYYGLEAAGGSIEDPIELQNKASVKLGGDELFHRLDDEYITSDSGAAAIDIPVSGHYYAFTEADVEDLTEYVDFDEDEYGSFEDMKYHSIMDLGRLDEGTQATLEADEGSMDEYLSLSVYRFDPVRMQALVDHLSESTLTLTDFEEDHIEGIVDIPEGRELLLAVPLTEGWEITVDGYDDIAPESFYGLFMKLDLSPGIHHISLTYHIPGFAAGVIISILSIALFSFMLLYYRRSGTK